jgi:glycosyltransferase involved in cell wall biosynthesis
MKTTKTREEERIFSMFGVIIDERKLSLDELIRIYEKSHAFLLPSMGEGWGLTLCEAQATGLPCIYTPWSGPNDFMVKDYSYPLRFNMGKMSAVYAGDGGIYHTGMVAKADIKHIVRRMEQVYYGYDQALLRGRKGGEHIQKNFTWDKAGEIMMNTLYRRFREWKEKRGEKWTLN